MKIMFLECPHEELTCGSLEERLNTREKKALLLSFLINEIKAARLFACDALSQPITEQGDKELTPYLISALKATAVPKPSGKFEPLDIIDMLQKGVDARLQSCVERPKPLLTAKLDAKQWKKVDKLVEEVAQNCRSRSLLLMKRIDVTVNSFLWCDRIKSRENEIRELFTKRRSAMSHVTPPDVADDANIMKREFLSPLLKNALARNSKIQTCVSSFMKSSSNRAQSYLNLEKWPEALMDCNRALELDPNFAKALYRRACALEKMGLKSSAIEDLDRCLKLGPSAAASALKDKLTGKRDVDVIHVACVEKGDELRSDSEFNEIVINIPQSTAEDQAKSVGYSLYVSTDSVNIRHAR
ncbi:hypothetical protein GCK32_004371, partial [Trichostrongylus colubriformis]